MAGRGEGELRGVAFKDRTRQADVSDLAPDFDLPVLIAGVKKRFHLREELKHRNVVLAFYPQNWQEPSAKQLRAYQAERAKFGELRAEVVGISVDSIMNTTSWERAVGPFDFAVCSDFWPHGEVSRAYGVFRDREPFQGASERAIFVVSQSGKIVFRKIYALDQAVPIDEIFAALREM
jgi:peroxiredoxin